MEPNQDSAGRSSVAVAVLIALALFAVGFMGGRGLRRPAEIIRESPSAAQKEAPATVVVHVVGLVKNPGVVTLDGTARVSDAIAKCGGSLPGADMDSLNLAARLEDGSQIVVGKKVDLPAMPLASVVEAPTKSEPKTRPKTTAPPKQKGGMVSLNHATAAQLESLPGVGPSTAAKILDYRNAHGGFSSIEELLAVRGIGPRKLAEMRPFLKL